MLLEDVTKNQFVQSPVTLVINNQSQNEYKCTQDVFRVLKSGSVLYDQKCVVYELCIYRTSYQRSHCTIIKYGSIVS